MNFWDQQFSAPGYKYGTQANAFLREQAHRFAPGSAVLVPGDGEGRNGVWLAQQGQRVTALDSSAVGLQKAQALAADQGVALTTQLCDLADWQPVADSQDAVVLIYVHLPPALRPVAMQRLFSTLRPGGWFLLEAFHPLQLGHASGGPKQVELLYTRAMLEADLGQMPGFPQAPTLSWEGETTLDEGPGHQGLAHVTRLLVQRGA